jgi:hypothetical protein
MNIYLSFSSFSDFERDAAIALDREDCHVTFGVDILPRRTDGTNTDPEAETISFTFEEASGVLPAMYTLEAH